MKKIPHTYSIIFSLILIAAALTWIVPAGEFERVETLTESGRVVRSVVPDSYHRVDQAPQTWELFSAFFKGFQRAPGIIAFILILGGTFWIINESKAIDMGVASFLKQSQRWERYRIIRFFGVNACIITSIMLLFSIFGAVFGMSEETIAFVIIFVPLAISMGYDSIVGVCMCFIAAGLGFAGCILNPFTLGIAQDIAGLPMFSGIEYRLIVWLIINVVGIAYVLNYASRVKRRPERSLVYEDDRYWRERRDQADQALASPSCRSALWVWLVLGLGILILSIVYTLTIKAFSAALGILWVSNALFVFLGYRAYRNSMQSSILHILAFGIIYLIWGVISVGWGFEEIAALFLVMGIASGVSMGRGSGDVAKLFIAGAKDILSAALVVALASGIIIILEDGKIIDTLLNGCVQAMSGGSTFSALSLMYGFQTALNAVITSGTAKAAMLMPIFAEISNLIGMSVQASVTAFHIGDGFTNLITPTSGVLIGVLEMARIPYTKWVRWAWKLIAILVVVGFLLLIPTVMMDLKGF